MPDKNLTSAIRAPFFKRHLGRSDVATTVDYAYDNAFTMKWRNAADTADVSAFGVNASNRLSYLKAIDFREITLETDVPVIRAGTYSTPLVYPAASQSLLKLYYSQTADTGADVVTFFYAKALGDAEAWCDTALAESNNLGAPGPSMLGAGQFHSGLIANAYMGAGATGWAHMIGAWLKVYADVSSHVTSGARVAPIWLDNQMSCTVTGGEEYSAWLTTGGTVPKAAFGFYTTSGGWANLLSFDATMVGKAPLSALKTASAASDSSILISINGVTKYIPVFNAAT